MRLFSAAIQAAIDNKRIEHQAFITFADTTTMIVGEDKIWQGGFEIDRAVSGQSAFEVGACVISEFKLILNNAYGDFDGLSWYGATIRAQFEAWSDDARTTSLGTTSLGIFDVIEVDTNGTRVKLTCYDNMYKFDIPYSEAEALLSRPNNYTPLELVQACCTAAGVSCAVTDMSWYTFPHMIDIDHLYRVGYQPPETKATTCRDALSYACAVSGNYAYINYSGEFEIGFYENQFGSHWLTETSDDPDYYALYYPATYHVFNASNMTKFSRDEENVTITGVKMTNLNTWDSTDTEYLSGSAGYVIELPMNQIVNPSIVTVRQWVDSLKALYINATFRPFKATHLSNLSIEAGDRVLITDQRGNTYKSLILHTEYSADGTQESECKAEPEGIVNGTRYTGAAKAVAKLTASMLPYNDSITQFGVTYTQGAIEAVDTKVNGLITGYEDQSGSAVSLANNTWTSVQTINVTAGIWLINYGVSFASNATGYRQIALTNSSSTPSVDRTMPVVTAVSGAATNVISTALYEASGAETLHVWAIQNSGAARNCWPFIKAVKLR